MAQEAFDPGKHGFGFVNTWKFTEADRRQLRAILAPYLVWGAILGAVAFGLLGAILVPFVIPVAIAFGLLGAVLVPLGLLAVRGRLESVLAGGYGLCGGMCFTVLDFYHRPDPRFEQVRSERPSPGTSLREYVWKRQVTSVRGNGARFVAWHFLLRYVPSGWPFGGGTGWLLAWSKREWRKLKSWLDEDRLVPVGLVRDTENIFDDHQVVAFDYEAEEGEAGGKIYLYDPNCPGDRSVIEIEFGERMLRCTRGCDPATPLRGFFCEAYGAVEPRGAIEG